MHYSYVAALYIFFFLISGLTPALQFLQFLPVLLITSDFIK